VQQQLNVVNYKSKVRLGKSDQHNLVKLLLAAALVTFACYKS